MFGGFDRDFHTAYHKMIPQTTGFTERVLLYQLFHHLNHWLVSFDLIFIYMKKIKSEHFLLEKWQPLVVRMKFRLDIFRKLHAEL